MSVGTLEEIIDDNHAIVSTSVGSEHYVNILSFVDKDLLEPGCTVLLNHKVLMTAPSFILAMTQDIHQYINKEQKFYSLPKRYNTIRRFEQRPFVGN